jgi:hypothetical protein
MNPSTDFYTSWSQIVTSMNKHQKFDHQKNTLKIRKPVSMAILLLSTVANIATPCSVNTNGLEPPK